jgi:hypothetical protein
MSPASISDSSAIATNYPEEMEEDVLDYELGELMDLTE